MEEFNVAKLARVYVEESLKALRDNGQEKPAEKARGPGQHCIADDSAIAT
jgi:hypothetical protein